jgi:ABC-2 type transport system ATP-binding protein
VSGRSAEEVGTAAWQAGLPVYELTTTTASLEEAFMQLTSDAVEYRTEDGSARSDAAQHEELAVSR